MLAAFATFAALAAHIGRKTVTWPVGRSELGAHNPARGSRGPNRPNGPNSRLRSSESVKVRDPLASQRGAGGAGLRAASPASGPTE
eukprot:14256129-Alexandrium_andersonii.AAC.1